jgi:hypothetical protein
MNDDDEFALRNELARKALDVLHRRVHEHLIDATISARELRLIVDTLTDTISGLIPWDVIDIIYKTRKELDLES